MEPKFVDPKNTVTVYCNIFANPVADFEWFRNGNKLDPFLFVDEEDRGRIQIKGNSLTINHVMEKDSGVYQCLATNRLAKISDSVQIIVRPFAPIFKKAQFSTIYVFQNSTVLLPCVPEVFKRSEEKISECVTK